MGFICTARIIFFVYALENQHCPEENLSMREEGKKNSVCFATLIPSTAHATAWPMSVFGKAATWALRSAEIYSPRFSPSQTFLLIWCCFPAFVDSYVRINKLCPASNRIDAYKLNRTTKKGLGKRRKWKLQEKQNQIEKKRKRGKLLYILLLYVVVKMSRETVIIARRKKKNW